MRELSSRVLLQLGQCQHQTGAGPGGVVLQDGAIALESHSTIPTAVERQPQVVPVPQILGSECGGVLEIGDLLVARGSQEGPAKIRFS
jgi:hypothetical protein